jgi:hypothetical protein
METDNKKDNGKQVYQKPRLIVIELAAEEVLAIGCKLTSSGFAPNSISPPCAFQSCSNAGS